ncbi:MAG TPA: hypothetical protein VK890_03960 [Bacteroidia bacterium]|jgi:hypothetical protein|nr:hypothetical protein [Bacteroidia bacterium]
MKPHLNHIGKFSALILLSAIATYSSAQTNAPAPAASTTTAPAVAPTGPTDYGKDARTMKIKRRIISFGFFSPVNQHISFGYDQLLGTDIVFTSQVGIIGPGINPSASASYPGSYVSKPLGGFVEVGAKLFFAPDFVTDGLLRYNSMQGLYFKPQVAISVFNLTQTSYGYNYGYYTPPQTTVTNYSGLALILNLGKQWILAHAISLDIYGGIGYSLNTADNNFDRITNYYSYEGSAGSIVFTGGVNIGVPF